MTRGFASGTSSFATSAALRSPPASAGSTTEALCSTTGGRQIATNKGVGPPTGSPRRAAARLELQTLFRVDRFPVIRSPLTPRPCCAGPRRSTQSSLNESNHPAAAPRADSSPRAVVPLHRTPPSPPSSPQARQQGSRACAARGGSCGTPRCSRIRSMTARSRMTAMNRILPSQRGHASASTPHTCRSSVAQSQRVKHDPGIDAPSAPATTQRATDARVRPRSRWWSRLGPGTMAPRQGELGANTPW